MIEKIRHWLSRQSDPLSGADQAAESQEAWREAWRGRRLRTLPGPLAIKTSDLLGLPDVEVSGVSLVPVGFEDTMFYPVSGQCPICGEATEAQSRRAINVHFRYRGLDAICVGAWGHTPCIERCAETEMDAGVPW